MTDAIGPEDLPIGAYETDAQLELGSRSRGGWCFLLVVLLLAVPLSIIVPNFLRARARGMFMACRSNCKNVATALELYASDNHGRYPLNLRKLTEPFRGSAYLAYVPSCPSAGRVTYENYQVTTKPDQFSFACCGNNHARALTGFGRDTSGYPRYHSADGLLDHP